MLNNKNDNFIQYFVEFNYLNTYKVFIDFLINEGNMDSYDELSDDNKARLTALYVRDVLKMNESENSLIPDAYNNSMNSFTKSKMNPSPMDWILRAMKGEIQPEFLLQMLKETVTKYYEEEVRHDFELKYGAYLFENEITIEDHYIDTVDSNRESIGYQSNVDRIAI